MNFFQMVIIVWAANGHANAHPINQRLTADQCIAMVEQYHAKQTNDDVPACIPDDIDF